MLQALTEPRTTGELAQLAGISGPGASQHTAVLRKAGLITTRRERNMAWHELTPLGRAMLTNLEGGAADRRRRRCHCSPCPPAESRRQRTPWCPGDVAAPGHLAAGRIRRGRAGSGRGPGRRGGGRRGAG
ncbi:winged helix-turn-helix domain-containing protein [Actinomadura keratinilytica]